VLWIFCSFEIELYLGRKLGRKYRTRDASANCTSMCNDVVNRGNGKSRCFDENIQVLYSEIERENRYLNLVTAPFSPRCVRDS
jgi:hypothetical protein